MEPVINGKRWVTEHIYPILGLHTFLNYRISRLKKCYYIMTGGSLVCTYDLSHNIRYNT